MQRCAWVTEDPLYIDYHDNEWGQPVVDSKKLFEFLILEGAQAGLSWITILKRREGYRRAFCGFDPERIAQFDDKKAAELQTDTGIIRNRLKIQSAIKNAKAYIAMQERGVEFSNFIWQFVDGQPIVNHFKTLQDIPANTTRSDAMSKELKRLGFSFVGSTICYAFMQACGLVDDHTEDCFIRKNVRF